MLLAKDKFAALIHTLLGNPCYLIVPINVTITNINVTQYKKTGTVCTKHICLCFSSHLTSHGTQDQYIVS